MTNGVIISRAATYVRNNVSHSDCKISRQCEKDNFFKIHFFNIIFITLELILFFLFPRTINFYRFFV